MSNAGLAIAVQHAATLSYAMQQCAVPWLRAIRIDNTSAVEFADLMLTVEVENTELLRWQLPIDRIAAASGFEVPLPDLQLAAAPFAERLERERADLVVRLLRAGERLAEHRSPIDLLAYNEWPGLAELPGALAAFASPNHPLLPPVLQDIAARLEQAGRPRALVGYQGADPGLVRAQFAAVHVAVTALGITYASAPASFERSGQKIRTIEQVLTERLGTCIDLALLYAALCEQMGLLPFIVVQRSHAFVGIWNAETVPPTITFGPAVELRKRQQAGVLQVLECTLACVGNPQPFAVACQQAEQRLLADDDFVAAVDIGAARRAGFRPLPVRTAVFVSGQEAAPAPVPIDGAPSPAAPAAPGEADALPPQPQPPAGPKDRLEHWRQKLLDLTMFNRLLNFVETKKTIRLGRHDLQALDTKLQAGGRVRVLPRPDLGQAGQAPRDLALASSRAGTDVLGGYLASELQAGRLRSELDGEELDDRLVEIYRHARTSLEESGANTLYLALGFLVFYETPQSAKPRRAPLLLLPLAVERTTVQEGCRFVLDDSEPVLNQTLLQYLRADFELEVPIGEALPETETGIDTAAVLAAFRQATLAMPRWEVEASACIGFFSFTKYRMWLDLADREALLQAPVLRHLIERPGQGFEQPAHEYARDELDDLDPATVLCPKDADSSQLAAVLAAAGGRSFVLEGPPGTGKSQTITNLIAQALANDQRVLFVAEKRAALEVVQRRLHEAGLGPFCLELHSQKSGPKAVLEQLRAALEVGQRRAPAAWAQVACELHRVRTGLNDVVRALHKPREHGSVHAAMAALLPLRGLRRLPLPGLHGKGRAELERATAAAAELQGAAAPIGVPARAPWWGVRRSDWTPALQREVPALAARLATAAAQLAAALGPVAAALGLDAILPADGPSRAQWPLLLQLAGLLKAPSPPPSALLRALDWRALDGDLQQAIDIGQRRDSAWSPLAGRWRRELLALELERLSAVYRRSAGSFVVWRWWQLRGPKAELVPHALGKPGSARAIRDDLEAAVRVQAEERLLHQHQLAAQALGASWQAGLANWSEVANWHAWVRTLRSLLLQLQPGALQPEPRCLLAIGDQLDGLRDGARVLAPQLLALQQAHDELVAAHRAAAELLALADDDAFGPADQPGFVASVAARVARWQAAMPALRDHCAYHGVAAGLAAAGAEPLVAAHARGDVANASLVDTLQASFLEAWLDGIHAEEPALARFRGLDHERAIARFRELDQQTLRLAGEVVLATLAAKVPQLRDTAVASSELGLLERELKKQRKHRPVRRLLAEIPGLFARLAPCVLMSPLSVAQYLARSGQRFDLVVFDEASQIPMWDAVGAIGRGRALVVVGDSRQLPPTSFFQRQAQGDDIGSDEVPEDLESVLDECGAAGLPRQHLDWHYRSRHESLIAFSNLHYYKNRLLTFPAPQAVMPGLGVRCIKVAGVYDRANTQQNRIEAEALVAEVLARLLDPARAGDSLGVVTFSQAQQVLVEDLLDQSRRQRPEVEAAFAAQEEPLFVKNLENVQGDERDVILFSICYGPDAQGRVYENYGPLNLQGGERRLNVAVTRARRELVVFTSVGPEQVAQRTAALGARHLRTFLDYALRGQVALQQAAAAAPGQAPESPFEQAVHDALVARGHEVHTQIGCSGYRIDLAVVDPQQPGRYLVGIECDGASYHSAATARDRDRLRASVLRGLGWTLCRVWSTDFWQDPDGELQKLEAAIAAAKAAVVAAAAVSAQRLHAAPPMPAAAAAVGTATESAIDSPSKAQLRADAEAVAPQAAVSRPAASAAPEPTEPEPTRRPEDPDGPRPHQPFVLVGTGTPEQFQEAKALRLLRSQIAEVLAAEGPIVFDRLARAVAGAWDVGRLTDRVRERVRSALPPGAVVDGDTVWASAAQRGAFRGFRVPAEDDAEANWRTAEDLPLAEIGNAMRWLLVQHQALAADDLAREAARCFGTTRLGAVVKEVMAAAIAALVDAGAIVRDGEVLRLG